MSREDFMTREETLARRQHYTEKFLPYLLQLGAIKKSDGIYEVGDWFCYPSRCHCMNKKTKQNMGIFKFLKMNGLQVDFHKKEEKNNEET